MKTVRWVGRLLAAALLIFPASPVAASTDIQSANCISYAYDVTNGVPRLVWVHSCDSLGEQNPHIGEWATWDMNDVPKRVPVPPPKNKPAGARLISRPQKDQSSVRRPPETQKPPVFPLPRDSDWRLSSPFGSRTDPLTGQPAFHHGVDLAAPEGTPVRAYDTGRVIWAGPGGDYGLAVGIRHDGNGQITWYAHLSEIRVDAGAFVRRGQEIGRVGATGRATGPHLHFEIRENGRRIDPWPALAAVLDAVKGGDGN